jgi:hypothetical protein
MIQNNDIFAILARECPLTSAKSPQNFGLTIEGTLDEIETSADRRRSTFSVF